MELKFKVDIDKKCVLSITSFLNDIEITPVDKVTFEVPEAINEGRNKKILSFIEKTLREFNELKKSLK